MTWRRLPCGCDAEPNDDGDLVVTASAFLCPLRHRQGDVTEFAVEVHPDQTTIDEVPW